MDNKWWTLIAVSVATFMLLLDVTIVNVALPAIQEDLDASFTDLQWVVDAYALTLAAALLISGSLADRIGRKRFFLGGLGVFTVASLVCGIAPDALTLNLARGVQGIGGAAMLATSLALLAEAFQGRDRNAALGVWGAVSGASVAVGPLVGGVLVEGLSWEWIFLVNIPIGIAGAALGWAKVSESRDPSVRGRPDWGGLVALTGALVALVLALFEGNDYGWGSPEILALLGAAVALLVVFVAIERRAEAPLLDLALFRLPTTVGASLAIFALASTVFSIILFLSIYLQGILEYDALETGIRFLPLTITAFFAAGLAGALGARFPARALLALGLGLAGVGLALMGGLDAGSEWTALLVGMLVCGIGTGLANTTIADTAIGIVPAAGAGMASGLNSTFRVVGVATGIAGLGAIFEHRIGERLAELGSGVPAGFGDAVAAGAGQAALATAPSGARARLAEAADEAFIAALNDLLVVSAAVVLAGAVLSLVLIRARDFHRERLAAAGAEPSPPGSPAPA